jgi:hypothetical protein
VNEASFTNAGNRATLEGEVEFILSMAKVPSRTATNDAATLTVHDR